MIVDCDLCAVRGAACGECVITMLLEEPPAPGVGTVRLDATERRALDALADAGMVPRLRLVPLGPDVSSRGTLDIAGRPGGRAKRSAREAS
jgi:hypothetical protein